MSKKELDKTTKKDSVTEAGIINEVSGAEEVTFHVTINGKNITLTVASSLEDAPFTTMKNFESGHVFSGFCSLIGEAQTMRLEQAGCTVRQFTDIVLPAWQEATGVGEDY